MTLLGEPKMGVMYLNNRRIILEEEMSLIEEKLAMEVEKKIAVDADNKNLEEFSKILVI